MCLRSQRRCLPSPGMLPEPLWVESGPAAPAWFEKCEHFNFFLFLFSILTLFLNPSIALRVKLLNHSIYLVRALLRAHFYLGENQTCSWAHNEIV